MTELGGTRQITGKWKKGRRESEGQRSN